MYLREVEHLEVIALMDNLSDPFSVSHPGMKFNETQYQIEERGCREDSGAHLCRACLGLSLLIRAKIGNERFSILFDTGPDDGLAVENAKRLGIALNEVDAIVLSHGHFDHISGVKTCLVEINKKIPVYCHPDVFLQRADKLANGELVIGPVQNEEDVLKRGGEIVKTKDPKLLFGGAVLLSGEVPRQTPYELGSPGDMTLRNGHWQDSSEMRDEQLLVFNLKGKGLCVFTGCGHPGVVNSLRYAQALVGQKIHMIMGGFHLAGAGVISRIESTVRDLEAISPDFLITGHCTGFKAQMQLTTAFGDRHIPYGVGTVFRFST